MDLLEDFASVADEPDIDREGPTGVAFVDVDLDDGLPFRVEHGRVLADGVLRGQLGPDHEGNVRVANCGVRRRPAVDANHAHRKRMGLGNRALSFI